jgi:hypothetical protein
MYELIQYYIKKQSADLPRLGPDATSFFIAAAKNEQIVLDPFLQLAAVLSKAYTQLPYSFETPVHVHGSRPPLYTTKRE